MNRIRLLILLLLLALVLAAPVLAQISAHYDLGWHLLSGGGGTRNSPHYQIDDVLGQWPDGRSSSAHYQLNCKESSCLLRSRYFGIPPKQS